MEIFSDKITPSSLRGDLREAQIVVTVGRGVRSPGALDVIIRFAAMIRAQIGATRGAVDDGLVPGDREIGLSGQRVRPELYIACGVSGANFHTIGMEHAGYIIAIDLNRSARIFELADCCIVEDVTRCIREVTRRLECEMDDITEESLIGRVIGLFKSYGRDLWQ